MEYNEKKRKIFCGRHCVQWELCSQPELSHQVTEVQTAPSPALQHHFLPQELLPRWRAKILGGWHVEATGMTLHDFV